MCRQKQQNSLVCSCLPLPFNWHARLAAASLNWFLKRWRNKRWTFLETSIFSPLFTICLQFSKVLLSMWRADTFCEQAAELNDVVFLILECWPTHCRNITVGKHWWCRLRSLQTPPTVKRASLTLTSFLTHFLMPWLGGALRQGSSHKAQMKRISLERPQCFSPLAASPRGYEPLWKLLTSCPGLSLKPTVDNKVLVSALKVHHHVYIRLDEALFVL